jgi:hypothetical protein
LKLLSVVLVLLVALPLMAAPRLDQTRNAATSSMQVDNTTFIDANRILMFVTNHGNFGRDLADFFGNDYGTYWPYTSLDEIFSGANVRSPLYAGGLWVGATDATTGDTLIIISEYSDEYVPGPMQNETFMPDVPEFRVYKLEREFLGHPNPIYNDSDVTPGTADTLIFSPNQEWQDYMDYAVAMQGAPEPWRIDTTYQEDSVTIAHIDTIPSILGDQQLWSVFNDADPAQHSNDAGETDPLGLEVQMTAFGFNRENPLGNIVFMRFQVFNNGPRTLENCYFAIWNDPDLGGAGDDLVGCDTNLSLGFTYNANNNDQYYGTTPPAYGVDFFQGPLEFTGDPADTAKAWGQLWPEYRNQAMSSFNKYINGTDPNDYVETYRYMNGLTNDGNDYTYNGVVSKFVHTGDPVTGEGDLDVAPADRRFMMSTGPVTFQPGDSTEILCALIVGQGGDRLSSISVLKYYDEFAQSAYDIDFDIPEPPAAPVVTVKEFDEQVVLTWTNASEVDPGDYPFQGYTVYQGASPNGPWTQIGNFDVTDGIAQIQDAVLDPLTGSLETRLVKNGNDGGLQRYFVVNQDYLQGGNLRNITQYYFRVEAYSYDPAATPVTLTSANRTPIAARPQAPTPNVDYPSSAYDTLDVEQTAGGSDGVITPLIVNPAEMTGDTYEVRFAYDTATGMFTDTIVENCEFDTTITLDTVISGDTTYIITLRDIDTVPGTCSTWTEEHFDTTITTVWSLVNVTTGTTLLSNQLNQTGDEDYLITEGLMVKVAGPNLGVVAIREVATAAGPLDPSDNVMYSLNSTGDWYVESDQFNNFARLNWQGNIGTYDWEFRFTAAGSGYYDWNTDLPFAGRAPFEVWNIGIGTPDDPSDDVQINFSILDDDGSGGWSFGDRIYPWEVPYVEPIPAVPPYSFPADFRIGRIKVSDNSGALTQPEEGTIIRFTTAKINTAEDVFQFTSSAPIVVSSGDEADLNAIKAVPNPFYLYGPYDPSPGNKQIYWHHLPERCSITIYNLSGELIRTLDKDDPSALAYWDLLSEKGLPVASGIYIWVVDAPGFGQKVGKMAIFMEQEVLLIY